MKPLRERAGALAALLWDNKGYIILGTIGVTLLLAFSDVALPIVAILVMAVAASYSTSYKRVLRVPPALELVTFTTVMVGIMYGPVAGAIYGAIVTLTAEVMTNALDAFVLSFVPGRAVLGLLAGTLYGFFGGNILLTGLAGSIMYNVLVQPMYLFMSDVQMRAKALFFVSMNVGMNFILFFLLGDIVLKVLSLT